jgi:hypothetical protein
VVVVLEQTTVNLEWLEVEALEVEALEQIMTQLRQVVPQTQEEVVVEAGSLVMAATAVTAALA